MEAERRQVTVLFTDMVGFTSFSERSGEEAAYTPRSYGTYGKIRRCLSLRNLTNFPGPTLSGI